ncbi:O-antigen ligase family protein [Virgibacillus byunsanensis]|uniref:O-antigen ligase family protein n=1 Tax=Virgibacillus byunsanensis TaxID=570945 RepID=A0ABW3LFJ4_9BACI
MNLELQKNHKVTSKIETMLIYFLLLQPVLDVMAYFNIPVSIVFRVLAMGVGFIYILLQPNTRLKRLSIMYIAVLALFMATHFMINYMMKIQFTASLEMTYMIKTVFFVELLIVYLFVMKSFSIRESWQRIVQVCIFINMAIIGVVMLVASLTNTGKRSYGSLAKEGHSGWFFSGNELSVILAMGFSVMILYFVNRKTVRHKITLLPIIGLVIWAMLTVGTKVSFGAVIIVLGVAILLSILEVIRRKKDVLNVTILSTLLLVTIVVTPSSPIGNNLNLTFGLNFTNEENGSFIDEEDQLEAKQLQQDLLSGRNDFLNNVKEQYGKAPLSQKVFGMGIGGNYVDAPKLIEMDGLDWYYNFGFLGFVLLILPLVYIGYHILATILKTRLNILNVSIIFVGLSICLGLGSALVAGHVLSSPASGIYLATLIGYLYVITKQQRSDYIKK